MVRKAHNSSFEGEPGTAWVVCAISSLSCMWGVVEGCQRRKPARYATIPGRYKRTLLVRYILATLDYGILGWCTPYYRSGY